MDPYVPQQLPLQGLDYGHLTRLLGQANRELTRYDGLLQGIQNPALLLSPLTTQEAVLSSKIEGTQATLDEVLELEAGLTFDPEKTKDIQEIVNYRDALRHASAELRHRPITLGLVKEVHRILLESVRGERKNPGEFRKDQNWIGRAGCSIADATFVPPNPLQLHDYLEEWERFISSDDDDFLVQVAVIHAQFELLHPFKDGNGRIGRLLIPLFLYSKKVLTYPMFYLSGYLEEHRDEYYTLLQGISRKQEWEPWIVFFLQAIIAQATDNAEKVRKILRLYNDMKGRFQEVTHSQYAINALDTIFSRPIFSTTDFVKSLEMTSKPTAMLILKQLQHTEIIRVLREGSGRRPAILVFFALLNLTEGRHIEGTSMDSICGK
jgi:Fic family protein